MDRPISRNLKLTAFALAATLGLATATPAWAGDPFPVQETFRGSAPGSQWRPGGSAELTGSHEAEGWLRLTSAAGGEFGYAYDNEAFPSADGALVEFEYADWGGSGADGLTFFMFNGATSETEFHAGQPGGALGYASCNNPADGLTNAYVGVGFDEYGNFTNLGSICGLDGTEFLANHVSVRGSASESYKLLATAPTTESLRAERSQARRVTIAVTPTGKLSVYVGYPDGTYQQVTENFQLPAAPETLKFGYVASTGALTDYHEIRDAQVVKPTQLTPSVTQTAGGHERGEPLTWTAVVRNEGPNATQREQLRATTGQQSLANASWTCEAAGGAECVTAAGAGLPDPEAGAMPQGSSLTYTITATPTATTDYAQITLASEPRGDTGELDPETERATATTDLTPLFEQEPTFTLAATGEASATPASALGGEIAYSYAWQRCEADGTACANIPGAQAPTLHTTPADTGHTIRFTQTARNSAGSATVASAVYRLPTVQITSAPARHTATREALLSFASSTREATLECSLDGAPWSACSSSLAYPGLADGEHTFSVRATYGGLGDPEGASVQWTVEATPPPAPTIVSAPPSPSTQTDPTFQFGGLLENDALECQLDEGRWMPCGPATEFTELGDGAHQLQARQVNRAGLDSGVTSYSWTIQQLPAAAPGPVSTPAPESTPSSAGATPLTVRPVTAVGVPAGTATHARRGAGGHAGKAHGRPHATQHGRRAKRRRHTARHKRTSGKRRRGAKHRRTSGKRRRGAKHKRTSGKRRRAAKHRRKSAKRRHAVKRKAAGRRRDGKRQPTSVKQTPPARTRKPPAKTRSPAATPQAEVESPAPASGPTPAREPPRHLAKPAPHAKARRPAVKPKSTRAPAIRPKHQDKRHTPAAAPKGRKPAPATTPGSQGKTPVPAVRRGHKHKRALRRKTRAVSTKLMIRPFRPRSSALTGRAHRLVRRVAAAVPHARLIVCVGYTDNLGPQRSNLALGLARARAVCAKLRALGVHAAFKAESLGARRPCASNATARGRALNRRVELRIVY